MKLEAICNNCSRRFLLVQILPAPEGTSGRCPFCGVQYGRHYLAQIPGAVRQAEAALDELAGTLGRLMGMRPGFELDTEAITRQLTERMEVWRRDESA